VRREPLSFPTKSPLQPWTEEGEFQREEHALNCSKRYGNEIVMSVRRSTTREAEIPAGMCGQENSGRIQGKVKTAKLCEALIARNIDEDECLVFCGGITPRNPLPPP
jgi:hypothetical protein